MLEKIINLIEEKKAQDIKVYDVKSRTPFFDYVVLATGTSTRNVDAIVQEIKKNIHNIKGVEGSQEGNWVLIDTGEIIINVFTREARDYYKLDEFYERN